MPPAKRQDKHASKENKYKGQIELSGFEGHTLQSFFNNPWNQISSYTYILDIN